MKRWTRFAVASGMLLFVAASVEAATVQAPAADTGKIQDVIDDALDGDVIQVRAGTYDEALTLKAGITLEGESTPATVLQGVITASDDTVIQRLTIEKGGIVVTQSTSRVTIRNNILHVVDGAGVDLTSSSSAPVLTIENNTFYANGVGCRLNNATGTVRSNIFFENDTALTLGGTSGLTVSDNHFQGNTRDGSTGDVFTTGDPGFVDPASNDFHFLPSAPAAVQTLGAFEGPEADPKPQPVVLDSLVDASDDQGTRIRVTWILNPVPEVTNYRVYYGTDATLGGTGAAEGNSPITVGSGQDTLDLTGLAAPTEAPGIPQGIQVGAGQGQLFVVWEPVAGATGYEVNWGTDLAALDQQADAGNVTSLTIGGVELGVEYGVTVSAYARTTYRVAVTALAGSEESVRADVGTLNFSASGEPSAAVTAIPQTLNPGFPDLPDRGGCFLGLLPAPSARSVQALLWLSGALVAALGLWGRRRLAGAAAALAALVLLCPGAARGEGFWVTSAAVGAFVPGQQNWGDYYDQSVLFTGKVGVGYRFARCWEVGLEGGYRRAKGEDVIALTDGSGAGSLTASFRQTLTDVPVQVYGLYQFRGSEEQLVVPYLGAGLARHYYWLSVDGGDDRQGHLSGYLFRGGLRVALDRFEPRRSARVRSDAGLKHTYLSLEGEYSRVDDFGRESVDLGGWTVYLGAVFDF